MMIITGIHICFLLNIFLNIIVSQPIKNTLIQEPENIPILLMNVKNNKMEEDKTLDLLENFVKLNSYKNIRK